MSQMSWTYIADDGARYDVGLFHGDSTGHLLVYCNARIVVIDFSVLASKNYSFFINDELFYEDITWSLRKRTVSFSMASKSTK